MFVIALLLLLAILFVVGFASSRHSSSVNEFVLAGQQFGIGMSTCSLIATWYGAESLLTLSDEVSRVGLQCIWIDPLGISLCLAMAGGFLAPLLYRKNVSTIGDLFLQSSGRVGELICSLIVIPSYFGWIAAQLIALSLLLQAYLGIPILYGLIGSGCVAAILCLGGGNTSIAWVNVLLLAIIGLGLSVLGWAVLKGGILFDFERWQFSKSIPSTHWALMRSDASAPILEVLGALAVGSIGNLPAIELIQRIRSAKDAKTARDACYLASAVYLALGCIPIFYGLCFSAHQWSNGTDQLQVVSELAKYYLSEPFQVVLFLAIVATILSTLTTAAMAPASMLGINVIEPIVGRLRRRPLTERAKVLLQRLCILWMLFMGGWLASSGKSAFELVRDCYGMLLSSIVIPFLAILMQRDPWSPRAITSAMLAGTVLWWLHFFMGWEKLGGPSFEGLLPIPHELGEALVSALVLWLVQGIAQKPAADKEESIGIDLARHP